MKSFLSACQQRLRQDYRFQVAALMLLVLAAVGIWYWLHKNIETTDNATIQCELVDVVSEVNGVIEKIHFTDDQFVSKNMPLVQIEARLFRAQMERAAAALNIAKANYHSAENRQKMARVEIQADLQKSGASSDAANATWQAMAASIEEAKQELLAAKVDVDFLEQNYKREKELSALKAISTKEFQQTQKLYQAKIADQAALVAKIVKLEKLRDSEQGHAFNARTSHTTMQELKDNKLESVRTEAQMAKDNIAVAQAEYDLAKLNVDRTSSHAKITGTITNRRVAPGEYIQVGQRIASIVACQDQPWINANFKETQIARMKKGQKAEFTLDSYPGMTFKGRVESISGGSGAIFSVLPPENATGNFTKVVKRMPVKILLEKPQGIELRVGASVAVRVMVD